MGLVPVYLGSAHCAVGQTNLRDSLQFSPTPGAVKLLQSRQITYRSTCGDRFDFGNRPNDFNIHFIIVR